MNHPVPDDLPDDEYFFYEEMRPNPPKMSEGNIPRNIDAEQAIISAMLQWPEEVIPEVVIQGGESLFYLLSHRTIFCILEDLWNASKAIDPIIVSHELRDRDLLESVGGYAALAGLFCDAPGKKHFHSWLDLLQEFHVRREIFDACRDTQQALQGGTQIHDLLDQAERRILSIRSILEKPKCLEIRTTVESVIKNIEGSMMAENFTAGLPSGFKGFDIMTNGLHPGELVVIGGAPGVGKSVFATNLVEAVAMNSVNPIAVGWLALQDSASQTIEKLIASRAGINLHRLRSGSCDVPMAKLCQIASEVADSAIHIEDREMRMMQLKHNARNWKMQSDINLLVIDYIQLLKGDSSKSWCSYEKELFDISADLKSIAQELHIPVVAFASISSAISELDSSPPRLGQLGHLWPVLESADLVVCFWEPKHSNSSQKTFRELHVLKQRNGPLGKVALEFSAEQLRFTDTVLDKQAASGPGVLASGEFDSQLESVVVSKSGIFPS